MMDDESFEALLRLCRMQMLAYPTPMLSGCVMNDCMLRLVVLPGPSVTLLICC